MCGLIQSSNEYNSWQLPEQHVHFAIIIWYVEK